MTSRIKLTALILASAALAPAALATPTPQAAAAQATVSPGTPVVDTAGAEVGTIESLQGDVAIIQTDRHKVAFPVASFTPHEGKLIIAATRNDLNTAADQAAAQLAAAISVGATVRGSAGDTVGSIEKIEGSNVTVKLPSGTLVVLPRDSFTAQPTGPVISLTAAQLQAQVDAATAAAAPAEAAPAEGNGE